MSIFITGGHPEMFKNFGINVKPAKGRRPKRGDKVTLVNFNGISGNSAARLARMEYCTVDDVLEVPIGENGDYEYTYEIYVQEAPGFIFGSEDWKFYK